MCTEFVVALAVAVPCVLPEWRTSDIGIASATKFDPWLTHTTPPCADLLRKSGGKKPATAAEQEKECQPRTQGVDLTFEFISYQQRGLLNSFNNHAIAVEI